MRLSFVKVDNSSAAALPPGGTLADHRGCDRAARDNETIRQAKVHRTLHHLNCEPGGICISSSAYDQVRGKVPIEVTDLGEQSLKNIARPVRAYSVVGNESTSRRTDGTAIENSPPALSIVVLPFTNIGGDPEQDYFVDGVTESLPQT
jgi:hypothetical protein